MKRARKDDVAVFYYAGHGSQALDKNGDEAEAELVLALDGAVAADLPWLRIIHGKGTGALRVRVAEVLQIDRRVKSFRLAPPAQGGSGVTIAELDR